VCVAQEILTQQTVHAARNREKDSSSSGLKAKLEAVGSLVSFSHDGGQITVSLSLWRFQCEKAKMDALTQLGEATNAAKQLSVRIAILTTDINNRDSAIQTLRFEILGRDEVIQKISDTAQRL
jgi:hypothetical protein